MSPIYCVCLWTALLIAVTTGASINTIDEGSNSENPDGDGLYLQRAKRNGRGFMRGQTQSQYLNFGKPEEDGKAEAEATETGSRSTVSGKHGMGQAQSQFSAGDCTDCITPPVYEYRAGSPDPLTLIGGANALGPTAADQQRISGFPGGPSAIIGQPGLPGARDGAFRPSVVSGGPSGTMEVQRISGPPGSSGQIISDKPSSGLYGPGSGRPGFDSSSGLGVGGQGRGVQPGRSGVGYPSGASRPSGGMGADGVSGLAPLGPGQSGQVPGGQLSGPLRPGTSYGPGSGRPGSDGLGQVGPAQTGRESQPGQLSGDYTAGPLRPGTIYGPGSREHGGEGAPGQGAGRQNQIGPGIGYPSAPQGQSPMYSAGRDGTGFDGASSRSPISPSVYGPSSALPGAQDYGLGQAQTGPTSTGYPGGPGSARTSYGPGGALAGAEGYAPGQGRDVQPAQPGVGYPGGSLAPASIYGPGGTVQGAQGYAPGQGRTIQPGQHGAGYPGGPAGSSTAYGPDGGAQSYAPGQGRDLQTGQPGAGYPGGSIGPPSFYGQSAAAPGAQGYAPGQDREILPGQQRAAYPTLCLGPCSGDQGYGSIPVQLVPVGAGYPGGPLGSSITYGPGGAVSGAQGLAPGQGREVQRGYPSTGFPSANYEPGSGISGVQGYGPAQAPARPVSAGYPGGPVSSSIGYGPGGASPGTSGYVPGQGREVQPGQPGAGYPSGPIGPTTAYGPGGGVPGAGQQVAGYPSTGFGPGGALPGAQGYGPGQGTEGRFGQPGTGYPTDALRPGALIQGTPTGGRYENGAASQPSGPSTHILGTGSLPGGTDGTYGKQPSGIYGPAAQPQAIYSPASGATQPTISGAFGTVYGPQAGQLQTPGSQPSMGAQLPGAFGPGTEFHGSGLHPSQSFGPGTGTQPIGGPSSGPYGQMPGGTYGQIPGGPGIYQHPTPGAGTGTQQSGIYRPTEGLQPTGVQPIDSYGSVTSTQPIGSRPIGTYEQGTGPQSGLTYDQTWKQPVDIYAPSAGVPSTGVHAPGAGLHSTDAYRPSTATIQYGPGQGSIPGYQPTDYPGGVGHGTGSQPEIRGQGVQPGYGPGGIGQTGVIYRPSVDGHLIPGAIGPGGSGQGAIGVGATGAGAIGGIGSSLQTGPSNLVTPAVGADDAFSQAQSAIKDGQASASAQGKKNGGVAKTQVSGTYSATGAFSASAMTSDIDRSANAQVSGGTEGAMSQAQGQGGAAQSQAQVQVNEKNGDTKASSQSGGVIHQSQSEVQANDKGGLADAQSSGPGQTSSQAQIGFRPKHDGSDITPSTGGGQASAQSGSHSGQSQSQIHGKSKFGVSYHGAAQSASGTKEQVATYREQNRELFHSISQFGRSDAVTERVETVNNGPALTSDSDGISELSLKASKSSKEDTNDNPSTDEDDDMPYDEYEDEEDYYNENPIKMDSKSTGPTTTASSGGSSKISDPHAPYHTYSGPASQQAAAAPNDKYTGPKKQSHSRQQKYQGRTSTETVPSGFRGTVNVEKKYHTKALELHKNENKLNISAEDETQSKLRAPDSFVTVTKSITGSMDNSKNPPQENKNFQSTYYTKSSTCGYFTFSCNIVYGANGRSKICRPKAPTNGKC